MAYYWREQAKRFITPHQRHQMIMLRERLYGPYARATARWRVLPNFLIIGAKRCGTTHLFNTLRHHPEVKMSRIKELHFFGLDDYYARGLPWYRAHFPLQMFTKLTDAIGEATPGYLAKPEAAKRIRETLPEAKLIVLLRNPTDRAISSFFYGQGKRERKGTKEQYLTEYLVDDTDLLNHPGIQQGLYLEHLKRYESYLRAGQLLVLKSEEYYEQHPATLRRVCTFLGIDPEFSLPNYKHRNASPYANKVSPEVRERFDAFFKPYNKELYEYLGTDMRW